ncbi:MAG: PadR family transcriptional regulator [Acidobacteria bacterium]|nr:PadR family transcriptional regulator [Acidobacteriota bacterium]
MSSVRVFLLGALAERGPMHGHQLRLLAEKEHVHMWTDFHVGGIYGALKRLLADDLVEPVRTEREGGRPERQIVRITDDGRAALDRLRLEALAEFSLRPDPFDLALARVGRDLADRLPEILRARRAAIDAAAEHHTARLEHVAQYLNLTEQHVMQHQTHRLRAELDWLDSVLADLPAIVADEKTREPD